MGLTYIELQMLSKFRSESLCGPFSMFDNLNEMWPEVDVALLEEKIKCFFSSYARNHHKICVATPPIHLSNHSVESSSKDLRPILYQGFSYQFRKMHKMKNQVKLNKKSKMYYRDNLETRGRRESGGNTGKSNNSADSYNTYQNYRTGGDNRR